MSKYVILKTYLLLTCGVGNRRRIYFFFEKDVSSSCHERGTSEESNLRLSGAPFRCSSTETL